MSDHRLTFIALNVSDLAASLSFYRGLVGIALNVSDHDSDLQDPWYGGEHAACSWTESSSPIGPMKEWKERSESK